MAKAKSSPLGPIAFILAACGVLIFVAAATGPHGQEVAPKAEAAASPALTQPICKDDWRSCASDEELANTWGGMTHAQVGCKFAANARAKYGEPKWPSRFDKFGSYMRADKSFVSEGKAILIEKDAQFQNRFGAMVHVRVECSYDLVNNLVSDVSLSESDMLRVTDEDLAKLREQARLLEEQGREDQARAASKPRAECHETADIICEHWTTPAAPRKQPGGR